MKLLIIKSQDESTWGSCKVISPNLHELYKKLKAPYQVDWFAVPVELLKSEVSSRDSAITLLKEKIQTFNPDRIVFVDHLPVPASILGHLSLHMNLNRLPPMVFHLYGDFTYFASEWLFLNTELRGHRLKFIVASQSQKRLVEQFLEKKEGVHKLCFPVNRLDYFYSAEERKSKREELKVSKEDFIILYSGRISLQKNVDVLLEEFSRLKKNNPKFKLWIVGAFDDVGAEFLGYSTFNGYMFQKIQTLLQGMDESVKKDVIFWGHKPKTELRKLKAAADCFISLSLYHDEDYGMSPAEALATGLPSLLTDWGGYSSFADEGDWDCKLVPVQISEFGLEIDCSQIGIEISRIISAGMNDKRRSEYSECFHRKFSIESNVSALENILKSEVPRFAGFNWLYEQYSNAMGMNWSKSKLNKFLNPDRRTFYYSIYRNYISKECKEETNGQ